MRDYLLFGVVFILLWRTFQSPMIGVLTFTWLSLMNPHRLTYGAAYDFPFAAIVVVVTLIALVFSKDKWRLSMTPVTVTLILFMVWMTATSFVALEPDLVWTEWNRVMKTLFMTLITIIVIKSKKDIIALAWVVGLSVAFYGLKGGIFTLVSGGNYHVYGPDGSYIADNNALALAFIAILPIVRFLQLQATKGWMRLGMGGVAILTAISAAGSYSRGALVAAAAMFFFLWIKSKQKFKTGIALVLVATIVFMVMPGEWFARMQTIDDYKTDDSSLG
ncbi:putative O-glycosylation ligase, exosortase A system-associated, partial [Glaciimonas sp. CA11.2]